VGGPPTYLLALADELVRRGHALRVVTHGQPGGSYSYPYPITRILREQPAPLRLARFTVSALTAARTADLLYVNDYGLPPTVANLILRKPAVLKIVGDFAWEYATRHALLPAGLGVDEFQRRRFRPAVERLRTMQRWYARRANLVIVPSRYLAGLVGGWGVPAERLRVIYNAPTPHPPELPARETRHRYGFTESDFVVVCVARLAPWKGLDVLIRALRVAQQWAPALRLLVVGDGEERPTLEMLAAPLGRAVLFTGELPRGEALAALTAADLVALVSGYEGLSHVLLEAMAAGRPIVASAVGGNLELIGDGDNGLLVPYGDERALAARLALLAGDPAIGQRLGQQARLDAEARSWPRLVEATLGVFDEARRCRPRWGAA
jgi:glycosyltransferase involved in cell wall biosynthesis